MSHCNSTEVPGDPLSTKSRILGTGASLTQDFEPVKNICAFLNAFHCYADEPGRYVEASHYCAHVTEDVRQCLIYDSPERNARLIGVEYMITPKLYETLDPEERKLWHSHVFEVKSGMLIMPSPLKTSGMPIPETVWEKAENAEMEEVIGLYGKTFHFWQVDRGDKLPLGMPKLMGSFTERESMPKFEEVVGERDKRFGSDWKRKKEIRGYIPVPELHPDADQANVNSKRKKLKRADVLVT
ncbi:DUF1264 domain-containing protein [Coprinopsis cinerea okayama7|uniref:DUF1264 domain-containing protein n=1 Tax=Coprinopsis cinerea (strain Okayama-7 / 130 / ATCC MYA-4618 / FGSC 9003) TaxID=240176 RepID=A8PB26_COPC7|nr:DUF1264 domain-containing protein [Coprinopsis cinerea okayama7\|eukprot:XP_001840094.1 DUF1264 domain-containing protein [Coprinopsis cinerea okayama7\